MVKRLVDVRFAILSFWADDRVRPSSRGFGHLQHCYMCSSGCHLNPYPLILRTLNGSLRVWAEPVGPTASVAGVRAGLVFGRKSDRGPLRSGAGHLVSGHQTHCDAELQAEFPWSREKRVLVGTSSGDQIPGRSHTRRSIGTAGGMHVLRVPVLLQNSLKYTLIRDTDRRDSRANAFPCHQCDRFLLESDYRNFSTTVSVFDDTNPVALRYSILKSSELAQYLVKFLLSGLV